MTDRDEATFPGASTFGIRRKPDKHLAFGTGLKTRCDEPLSRFGTSGSAAGTCPSPPGRAGSQEGRPPRLRAAEDHPRGNPMKHRTIGRNPATLREVSVISLGAMRFAATTGEPTSCAIPDSAA